MMFPTPAQSKSRPLRILVLGANGQFGTDLVEALVARHSREEIITADLSEAGRTAGVRHEWLDVMDKAALTSALQRHNITQVYNLAAGACRRGEEHPWWVWQLNVQGLLNVLECARLHGVERVFWPSSHTVFGPTTPQAAAPQHTVTEPGTLQGITKLAGEGLCDWYRRTHGLDVRCLRFPGMVSWQTPPSGEVTDYASAMFAAARHKLHFTCNLAADTPLPLIYMPDAVAATLALMDHPADELAQWRSAYNVMSCTASPGQLADQLQKYLPGFSISYEPDAAMQRIADGLPHSLAQDAAWQDWGWTPRFDLVFMVAHMLRHLPGQFAKTPHSAHSHVPEAGHPAA